MATDFAELLYRSLPGLYRDKDELGELRRFIEIMASPLAELEASITTLHEDLFVFTCRPELLELIASLVGVEVDHTLPTAARRSRVADAVRFYRSKATQPALARWAGALTGWQVTLVDFSLTIAQIAHVETLDPVALVRDQVVFEQTPGSGHYALTEAATVLPMFDALTGRPITREALAADPDAYAGRDGRFTLELRGADLFVAPDGTPWTAVAADLTDFAAPLAAGGGALLLGEREVAIDPALGRLLIADPLPLAGNLRVTYHALAPARLPEQVFDLRDPGQMRQLGRSDDRVPRTLDIRAPRDVHDRTGHQHFDNHGLFVTPCRVRAQQRLLPSPSDASDGRLFFDPQERALQLLDGLDGAPLTRARLAADPAALTGQPRGFDLRVGGRSVGDPELGLQVVAANLTNFAAPRDPDGAPLAPAPTDVAVDPQLGRVLVDLAALGISPADLRVDYLLGEATTTQNTRPLPLPSAIAGAYAFAEDGRVRALVDGLDGTPIDAALRLGRSLTDYHGQPRGWRFRRNGVDVTATLTPELADLGEPSTAVAAGRVAIDPRRGRFRLPSGFLAPGDQLTVDHAHEDTTAQARMLANLAQRMTTALPAGVVPVVVDTRSTPVQPDRIG